MQLKTRSLHQEMLPYIILAQDRPKFRLQSTLLRFGPYLSCEVIICPINGHAYVARLSTDTTARRRVQNLRRARSAMNLLKVQVANDAPRSVYISRLQTESFEEVSMIIIASLANTKGTSYCSEGGAYLDKSVRVTIARPSERLRSLQMSEYRSRRPADAIHGGQYR